MGIKRGGYWLLGLLATVVGMMCSGEKAIAQDLDEPIFDERAFVPLEQNIAFEGNTGIFLLDNSRTKNGRDFYEFFYQRWLAVQTDTTVISPTAFSQIGEELTVSIDEMPIPGGIGTSTAVSMTVNDVMIYQQFLQPRLEILEGMAADASSILTQYVQNFQEFQNQLGSEDQQGNGIY